MKKFWKHTVWGSLAFFVSLNILSVCFAVLLEDVVFEERFTKGDFDVKLVGYAIKKFLAIKAVGVSFYLPDDVTSDRALDDIPKRLEVVYLQNFPKKELDQATRRGIKKNVSIEQYAKLEDKIEELNEYWPSVSKNDRIGIDYLPGKGMEISVNGVVKGTVEGDDIARALFSVWIGDNPADKIIRKKLLGSYQGGQGDE